MKKMRTLILFFCLISQIASAHVINGDHYHTRIWQLLPGYSTVEGTFLMLKNGRVYIETAENKTVSYPLASLSAADAHYALQRAEQVASINALPQLPASQKTTSNLTPMVCFLAWLSIFAMLYIAFGGRPQAQKPIVKYARIALSAGAIISLVAFSSAYKTTTVTNPLFIDSAFTPYRANVTTHWDSTWFYVASYGIAAHEMMAGIINWQQQVPIPQCYTGSNAWAIPLNPVVASTPVSTAHHFFRGAIGIAANGIPIFNALTNTGVDAKADGQLDDYGGHCGRADDYHYHIAPLHLQATAGIRPIAFALDGYAVYGTVEPSGTAMTPLDSNHGHYGATGVYHYHGTNTYPYMIGNMVGRVTEDTTLQIVPQAMATPVRPAQTPLPGAVITHCLQVGTNGYKLVYTLGGQTDTVHYYWTSGGVYNFSFITPTGTTAQTYTGFAPCYVLPTAVTEQAFSDGDFLLTPNPAKTAFSVVLSGKVIAGQITDLNIYNMAGTTVYSTKTITNAIPVHQLVQGNYIVVFNYLGQRHARRLVIP